MPKVSVIIPCYNLGAFIDEAVESVLCQTYEDFEVIIIDDGSTDSFTINILSNYIKPKTEVFRTVNKGVGSARNLAISKAKGDYILPLDADDKIAPTYMAQAVDILDNDNDVGIVYCEADFFGGQSGKWLLPDFSPQKMLYENLIFSSAFFRKADWEAVGGYNPNMKYGWEDWDFWLAMMRLKRMVVRLPEILFFYRVRYDSRDRSISFLCKCKLMARMLVRHRGLYFRQGWTVVLMVLLGTSKRLPMSRTIDGNR